MLRSTLRRLGFLTLILLARSAYGIDPAVEEVEACVQRNLPRDAVLEQVELRITDRAGNERAIAGHVYWRQSKDGYSGLLIRIAQPPELAGSAYLILEKKARIDMFVYLPELGRVRRITPRSVSGSLFGRDFTYADLRRLQNLRASRDRARRLPDTTLDGVPVYAVEVEPDPEESTYSRIVAYVDRERCVPLQIDFYEPSDAARKLITARASSLERVATTWVAREVVVRDLKRETETVLRIDSIEIDADLPERVFSEATLAQGRSHSAIP